MTRTGHRDLAVLLTCSASASNALLKLSEGSVLRVVLVPICCPCALDSRSDVRNQFHVVRAVDARVVETAVAAKAMGEIPAATRFAQVARAAHARQCLRAMEPRRDMRMMRYIVE